MSKRDILTDINAQIRNAPGAKSITKEMDAALRDRVVKETPPKVINRGTALTISTANNAHYDWWGNTINIQNGITITVDAAMPEGFRLKVYATGVDGSLVLPGQAARTITAGKNPVEICHEGADVYKVFKTDPVTGGGGAVDPDYTYINAATGSYTLAVGNGKKVTYEGGTTLTIPIGLDTSTVGFNWFENRKSGALVKVTGGENYTFKNEAEETVNVNQLEIGKKGSIEGSSTAGTLYIKGDWTYVVETTLNNVAIIDFGGTDNLSTGAITNVTSGASGQNVQLVDTSGLGNLNWYFQLPDGQYISPSNSEGYLASLAEFPISACRDFFFYGNASGWTSEADVTTRIIRLVVDDVAAKYKVRLLSSRNQTGERRGRFTIGGVTQIVNAVSNATVTEWLGVAPNAQGQIDIVIRPEVYNGILYLNTLSLTKQV